MRCWVQWRRPRLGISHPDIRPPRNPRLCKTNLTCFREPTTLEHGSEQAPLRTPARMTRTRGCTCLCCTRPQARCPRRQLRNGFRILRVVNAGSGSCDRWLMQPRGPPTGYRQRSTPLLPWMATRTERSARRNRFAAHCVTPVRPR